MASVGNVVLAAGLIVAAASSCCLLKSAITSWVRMPQASAVSTISSTSSQAQADCPIGRQARGLAALANAGLSYQRLPLSIVRASMRPLRCLA
jgi:hypothetical protein